MGHRASRLALGVLCLFLGLALVVQFRTQETVQKSTLAPADQAQVVTNLVESNATLRREIGQLESQIASYYEDNGGGSLEAMVQELNRVKMLNGLVELTGPGVEVIVSAPPSVEEMHDLINELRNAGAEAIALNGQRIVTHSVLLPVEEGFLLEGELLTPPYRFVAIGHSETLERALERKGGVIALLRTYRPDLTVLVQRHERVLVPVYERERTFQYARPVLD